MTGGDWQDALRGLLPDDYRPEPEQPEPEQPAPMPRLTITLDRKRAGKTATIISGFDPDDPRALDLAKDLKRALATGGSCRGGEILLQGDCVDAARDYLRKAKYKVQGAKQ